MRNRKNFSKGDDVTDINISPLIDMVFILLIFFIVTTVFVEEKGMMTTTPDPTQSKKNDDENLRLSLLVRGNGQILAKMGGEERDIGFGGVRAVVQQEMNREVYPIVINVEKDAIVDYYVRVHDNAYSAGAHELTMKIIETQ